MKKPSEDEPRNPWYVVAGGPGQRHALGHYVGETKDRVVLSFGEGVPEAFLWTDVEPVVRKPQAEPEEKKA